METRANFILIGAFTLLAIVGTLGFFIWLASVQIDRKYETYGVLFEDVSGLDASGDVLFNGIPVGKVIGLRIYERDPSKVFTTIEIDATTPVQTNTYAQLQSQGVTGVAYISLSGGAPGAPPLTAPDGEIPIIPARRSTLQTLTEDAPDLLAETTRLLQQLQVLTGPENQSYVGNILRNLDQSSARLDQALDDFSDITGTLRQATAQITRFTGRLEPVADNIEATLQNANGALQSAERAFDAAEETLAASRPVLEDIGRNAEAAERVLATDLPDLLAGLSDTVARAGDAITDLQGRSGQAIDSYASAADLLNQRLIELEQTLIDANTAFAAVTEASDSFDLLVDGDGTLLVAEARDVLADAKAAIATIEAVVLNDVPAVVADIRGAVATASDAVDRVAADLTGLTGRFDPLADTAQESLTAATALFDRAGGTLTSLERTLAGADGALSSAERAFDAADAVLQTDLAPVLGDIRSASERISRAVEDVTRDVPAIAADLRDLIARADRVVAEVQGAVAASAPGISDFARTGLPELSRLGTEARGLVNALDSLVRRIERDPARFLLDNRVPEYRR